MDFFTRLTEIFMCWGGFCLMGAIGAGIENDCSSTEWAKKWWPRLLKLAVGFFFLASMTYAFNF